MPNKDIFKIIKTLNTGADGIKKGISIIKSVIPVNDEIDLRIWRIEKEIKQY